jgi:endonuclease/exonuclease/phosphatase (EEP) superfamily protein YafD
VRRSDVVLAAYPVALLVVTAIDLAVPQRSGPIALAEIFAPHLVLLSVLLVPFALRGSAVPALRVGLAGLLVVGAVRFVPEWISLPSEARVGTPIEILTWNLELGSDAGRDLVAVLTESRSDVVVLQELTPDHVTRLEGADRLQARFPHRVLQPSDDVLGIGLLSTFPITSIEPLPEPVGLVAELDIGGPSPLVVLSAHPLPPRYALAPTPFPIPIAFEPRVRDESLGLLRERVGEVLDSDRQLILLGDFNVAPTEPAYADLAADLIDVHAEVGLGPGWTWRPRQIEAMPAGLLRIDYVFVGGGIRPVGSATDCAHPGDHCLVTARVLAG